MTFEKIPKEKWDSMTQDEKNYATLEFQKDQAKEKYKLLMASRILSGCLILVLIGLLAMQIFYYQDIANLRTQYGQDYGCYLCGKYSGKSCSCAYNYGYDSESVMEYLETLGQQNLEKCESYSAFQDRMIAKEYINLSSINFSLP